MPKSSKFHNRNVVRVSFAADSRQRMRADMGAQILFGRSFALQCKKLYQECISRAPLVQNVPRNNADVRDMTREELFFAKFLSQDRDFVEAILDIGPDLKPGEFLPSIEVVKMMMGHDDAKWPRTDMIGLGRVMKVMGWPRRRQLRNGKLVWGYVKPARVEVP